MTCAFVRASHESSDPMQVWQEPHLWLCPIVLSQWEHMCLLLFALGFSPSLKSIRILSWDSLLTETSDHPPSSEYCSL